MNVSEYIETVIAEVKATLSHTILTSVSTRIRVNLGYFEGTATSSSANSLPATAHQVAMELSRISTKHRGSSTRPTKNFRETCFTYTTNAQWRLCCSYSGLAVPFYFLRRHSTGHLFYVERRRCGEAFPKDISLGRMATCGFLRGHEDTK